VALGAPPAAAGQTGHRRGEADVYRYWRSRDPLLAYRPPDLRPDPAAHLRQELRLMFDLAVWDRVIAQVGIEVNEGLIQGICPVERDQIVGEEGPIRIRQPPAAMVKIGIFGHVQLQLVHGRPSQPVGSTPLSIRTAF
jgi:hypothetical protein